MSEATLTAEAVPVTPEHAPELDGLDTVYGLLAEYDEPEPLLEAARKVHDAGFKKVDAYTPYPVEGLADTLGFRDTLVPWIMFSVGILAAIGGFSFLAWCTVVAYPLNIGGKPPLSWPMWIPITFEITVLSAALTGIAAMFALNGLPMPHHPLFGAEVFTRASQDRFFLCVEAKDPQYDEEGVRTLLAPTRPLSLTRVIQEYEGRPPAH